MKKLYNIKQDQKSSSSRKGCFRLNLRTKRIIRFGLLFAWIGLTIFLSEQSGPDSARMSAKFTKFIMGILPIKLSPVRAESAIREIAHFGIHFVLAILAYRAFVTVFSEKMSIFVSLIICSGIALFDEIIQWQISSRAFEIFDLVLNVLGVSLGLLVGFIISKTLHLQKPSRN